MGLMSMWISFGSMGLMFLSIVMITWSRTKMKNQILRIITGLVAYVCMLVSAVLMIIVLL